MRPAAFAPRVSQRELLVLTNFRNWLDHRTGYRKFISALLIEHIPGGARWRYVWGSALLFVFMVQLITGLLLMTAYSPGDSTAWASVYFIQYEMDFGWLIRGLHHFGSQTMVVLIGLHMLQVVIAGAHLPPREVNWWLGLALLAVVLGLSLTGYLLPWDQKGYWATQVATNIAGSLPAAGPDVRTFAVGGPEYGHHTLTRFYMLHVGVFPALLILLAVLHLVVFRRHGVTAPRDAKERGDGWFWPDQAFRDMLVSMLIFAAMLTLVLVGHGHTVEEPAAEESLYARWAHAGRAGLGANLDAPADPSKPYPARPEWYFLFLFQLLKYFEGERAIIGTVIIPAGVGLLLFILPLLGYGKLRPIGHLVGVLVVVGLLTGVVALTYEALAEDTVDATARGLLMVIGFQLAPLTAAVLLVVLGVLALLPRGVVRTGVFGFSVLAITTLLAAAGMLTYWAFANDIPPQVAEYVRSRPVDPEAEKMLTEKASKFQAERAAATVAARRAIQLARDGVPAEGAGVLLHRDPLTQGKLLFGQHCATCHTYGREFQNPKATASDLEGFGTEAWVRDLLRDPRSPRFFGRTEFKEMAQWVGGQRAGKSPAELKDLDAEFDLIARWLGGQPRGKPKRPDDPSEFARGYRAFKTRCMECHTYEKTLPEPGADKVEELAGSAPDLTGYGSPEWVRMMILSPDSFDRYGEKNRMPAFRDRESPTAFITEAEYAAAVGKAHKDIKFVHLSEIDRELIIRWMFQDGRAVFGGDPITAAPKR